MTAGNIFRRLRGALGIAVVWSAGWFAGAFALFAVLLLTGIANGTLMGALRTAAQFGVMGGIAGTAFSTFIGLRYHGHGLARISWVRFGIGGAIVTGLFVPGFIVAMRLLSGDGPLPLIGLMKNGLVGVVFGGAAAVASLKLAQAGTDLLSSRGDDGPGLLDAGDPAPLPGTRDV